MNGWFLALIIILALNLGLVLSRHGQRRTDKYNVWSVLISGVIELFIVYMAIIAGF